MPRKTIYFKGFIANVGSSILKVNLEHGFKFESLTRQEGLNLVSTLDRSLPRDVMRKLTMRFPLLDSEAPEPKFYCIKNSCESDCECGNDGVLTNWPSGHMDFHSNFFNSYLVPTLRLMRLFKEGNICMPLWYYFFIDDSTPKPFSSQHHAQALDSHVKYNLDDTELSDLEHFIQSTNLPFEKSFLELAFENFELSYEIQNHSLAFLCLMISLETLLNPGDRELRYRVSRNTAVLLGEDREESNHIFKEVKDLYDKRSKLVHTGDRKVISPEDLLKLRDYVRKSIKKINTTGNDKQNLFDSLNVCGFGESLALAR